MFNILLTLLLPFASLAGKAPAPALNPQDQWTLQGVVVSAAGGEPLRKAVVSLCPAETLKQCTGVITDATGQFELKGVDPGRYRLSATCNGYVGQQYGQRSPEGPGTILTLSGGEKLSGISLRLIQAAVITGHVYDEDGAPVPDAVVSELRFVYTNGRRQLRAGAVVRTNDLGEYRIWGLDPGLHFVLAEYNPTRPAATRTDIGYLPTFYPGVLDSGHAAPIVVRGGDEFSGANIDLQPARTVCIRGRVYGGSRRAMVFLLPRDSSAFGGSTPQTSTTNQDGDYELDNVIPGQYYIYARSEDGGRQMITRQLLEVSDTNIDHLDLTLTRGIDLYGHFYIEGISILNLGALRVSLSPRNARMVFGHTPSDWIDRRGSFTLQNVYPGDYDIQIENLPENYYLQSAQLDGSEVLGRGLTIDLYQAPKHLSLLVSPNGGIVYGVVVRDQQPFSGATVALVPDPPHRNEQHLFRSTATDQFGRFVLHGVPPGEYKLFAWESIEHAAYTSSDFLQPFELRGESAHVSKGSHISVQLDLIPAKDSGR